jgi:hypothetical protein
VQSAHIEVVANEAEIAADGSEWEPVWRHDTELEHDKALSINEARAIAKEVTADDKSSSSLMVRSASGSRR